MSSTEWSVILAMQLALPHTPVTSNGSATTSTDARHALKLAAEVMRAARGEIEKHAFG